jgi:hypothetical protein
LLLSDSEDESSGPKKNVSQLGMLSGICLDSVYLRYLQEKAKNPPKKVEDTKQKKKSRRRASIKPSTSTPVLSSFSSPRRNSAPKVVVTDITPASKDDADVRNAKPKRRGRRGSLTSGQLSPRDFDRALNLGGIREDQATDSGGSTSLTPSPTPRKGSIKEENNENGELKTCVDAEDATDKPIENLPPDIKEEELLLTLMKKNVKEGEYTPQQRVLYDARDTLWEEYQRRKKNRQRIGHLLRKKAKQLRGILGTIRGKGALPSDLALKARANDLQAKKKEARRNQKRRRFEYSGVNDANKI